MMRSHLMRRPRFEGLMPYQGSWVVNLIHHITIGGARFVRLQARTTLVGSGLGYNHLYNCQPP